MINIFNYNGKIKQLALVVVDIVLVASAFYTALLLRFEGPIPGHFFGNMERLLLPVIFFHIVVFAFFGLYRRLWRYASVDELMVIVLAVSTGAGGTFLFSWGFGLMLPRTVYIIFWFLLLVLVGGSRLSLRILAGKLGSKAKGGSKKNILIIGAGDAGVMVARELRNHQQDMRTGLVGFIDDDPDKQGQIVQGIPVLGGREKIPDIIREKNVKEIVIAIPSAPYSSLRWVIDYCQGQDVKIKTVPGLFEILSEKVSITHLKEVEIEDLLRRAPVEVDVAGIAGYLGGKTVMVTGAAGSIGSELCRQLAKLGPVRLLLLDRDEGGIFNIHREIKNKFPLLQVVPLLKDIRDFTGLENVFLTHKPQVIFHAAAYKHVPLLEDNVDAAVENNVLGSKNLMDLAHSCGVERFVLISSDKAVNPSSVMGTTKRVSEVYLQHKARQQNGCIFCAVRFGNVLGSRGSVVPIFKDQIASGGPVEVTHPEMTRYFMTIPEAVQLVIQAGAYGEKGEIFILDMGEPVKIMDLARDMILLSGLKPEEDIEIKITGIRPGEKLFEELFLDKEDFLVTRHQRIFIAPDTYSSRDDEEREIVSLGEKLSGLVSVDLLRESVKGELEKRRERKRFMA